MRHIFYLYFNIIWIFLYQADGAELLHTAPIIISAKSLPTPLLKRSIGSYRVFQSDPAGNMKPIPFQIDEKDQYGDYILNLGKIPNSKSSNGIFEGEDEITFMGNDVGSMSNPKNWPTDINKPDLLYQVKFEFQNRTGSVFIGFYQNKEPPKILDTTYVSFDLKNEVIKTTKYHYYFDNKNYLVVKDVDLLNNNQKEKLVLSSTFYLKTDLKYFLTLEINQASIQSSLEAYKVGPIRTITRVTFNYELMKLNFDLGMYTEVSFFSNSVILPAVVDNPIDGKKILNPGSLFYYGFALNENASNFKFETNMPPYEDGSNYIKTKNNKESNQYWIIAEKPAYFVYLQMTPSVQMRRDKNIPNVFVEAIDGKSLLQREDKPQPLGKSRVNMAVAFSLDRLEKSVHDVSLQLFVDTETQKKIDNFKNLEKTRVSFVRCDVNCSTL